LEARNLVEQAMLERQATELSEKQRLLSTPADLEVEDTFDDGTTVILRKIIPETASGKPVAPSLSPVRETQPTRTPSAFTGETIVNHRTVSLVVTVFDHTQSMIKWRFGEEEYTVWANDDLSCIQQLTSLHSDQVSLSVFPFIYQASSRGYRQDSYETGRRTISRDQTGSRAFPWDDTATIRFSIEEPNPPVQIINEVAALESFYHQNREALKLEWRKRQAYSEAYRQWKADHPEKPREIIINYRRIR